MYTYEDRMKAVNHYLKYDMSIAAVICELGYPSRMTFLNYNFLIRKNNEIIWTSCLAFVKII